MNHIPKKRKTFEYHSSSSTIYKKIEEHALSCLLCREYLWTMIEDNWNDQILNNNCRIVPIKNENDACRTMKEYHLMINKNK